MSRKVIQIATHGKQGEGLTVLCDDGSIWRMGVPGYWTRVETFAVNGDSTGVPLPPPPAA
jgi:hypothetical protein